MEDAAPHLAQFIITFHADYRGNFGKDGILVLLPWLAILGGIFLAVHTLRDLPGMAGRRQTEEISLERTGCQPGDLGWAGSHCRMDALWT